MPKIKKPEIFHNPVLLREVLEAFSFSSKAHLKKGVKIIDATLGLGGHTEALVKSGADVLGIETDNEMLKLAIDRLKIACPTPKVNKSWGSYKLVYGNFRKIGEIANENGFSEVDGVLFDFGVSSPQITSPDRGISFGEGSAPLDMRIDRDTQAVKGSDLLNVLRKDQLIELFGKVLNPKVSNTLSSKVVKARELKKIETVADFRDIIHKANVSGKKIDIATLPFLALRMAVNSEAENISAALPKSVNSLRNGGRIVAISFHSGEDSVVKKTFLRFAEDGLGTVLTKNPITPSASEIVSNRRSRSAKMRIFQKK
jgi:16S rRNA (cytosine1402-N4)-methyltransferase